MSEPLDSLVSGWQRHFAAADQTIDWLHAELELSAELAPGIWLAGCVDAVGRVNDELFFGEWKTANPREKKTWKQVWRMNPQSLTYGVLCASRWPELRRFTVRKAFKEQYPSYDHAWFRYSDAELNHWRGQIIQAALEIQEYLGMNKYGDESIVPWPTNFKHCFKFGVNYACPFFESACNRQEWGGMPAGAIIGGDPSWSFTEQRTAIQARDRQAIVLSATTIADWFDCRELYRKRNVELITPVKGEALILGGNFHTEIAKHYAGLIKVQMEAE
jgi:hypothetical protein